MIQRIISGGQTGADRGGLDAAIVLGLRCGGWCPAGYRAEDGRIPSGYMQYLTQTVSWKYDVRTRQNIEDSDGTLIFTFTPHLTGGSFLTSSIAGRLGKPRKHIVLPSDDLAQIRVWVSDNSIETLNVAGSRASKAPGIQAQVCAILVAALRKA